MPLKEAVGLDGVVIPYEKEEENTIKNIVKDFKGKSIGIFIGPEGGFTEEEIKCAIKNNLNQ